MALAIALIVIVVASVLFNIYTPWWFTPVASNWGNIDDTLIITLAITGLAFVIIGLFMAYTLIRYRHREGQRAHYEPENKKLEWWLTGLTSVGIVAMLAPGLVVYSDFIHPPEHAANVEIVGQQWQWSFRYPGEDGQLGTADTRHIDVGNPFGLDPEDPHGQDDRLVQGGRLHLPLGQPVKFLMRSKDVLHNFYVPQFRAKMDMVPGLVSYIWMTPTKTGEFEILCAELCGLGHFNMRGKVVVESPEAFRTWLDAQPTFARSLHRDSRAGLVQQGQQLALSSGCLACHSVDGSPGLAPTWFELFGKQETLADGTSITVDAAYLRESILNPNAKLVANYPPVMVAYDFSEEQLDALVAYTQSLTAAASPVATGTQAKSKPTNTADLAAQGREVLQQQGCRACHSLDGSRGIGPSLKDLFGSTETLADGSDIVVDAAYLEASIATPKQHLVKGYAPIMPAYSLSQAQLDAIIAATKAAQPLSGEDN